MSRLYDPISQTVFEKTESTDPSSLQSLCRKGIIQSLTLGGIEKVNDLPLPRSIKCTTGKLSMKDFHINVERLGPEDHVNRCYPATCCLTDEDVLIKIIPKNTDFTLSDYDPSMVATFEEDGHFFCILLPTQSLAERIDKAKETGSTLEHSIIWQTITKILHIFQSGKISPVTSVASASVRYHTNGQITVNSLTGETASVTVMEAQMDKPVYEAPEVLGRQNPDSKAHSWNIGCLLYEMLALEPAFYDRSGVNPFSVFMDIMQGNLPPVPPNASDSLADLVNHCLVSDPTNRISLQDITEAILLHNSKNL